MLDKTITKFEKEGKLKKQKAGIVQVEALLKEANKILHLAERATYLLAYIAMLKAGRALLLLKGYVPDDGAQHKTVVDVTTIVLGPRYENLTEQFETMRRKRNELTYEAGILLSRSEAERAFLDAMALIKKILSEVKSKNPQLELEFDLDK